VNGGNGNGELGTEELMLNDVGGILAGSEGKVEEEDQRREEVNVDEKVADVIGLESALQDQEGEVTRGKPA
jgi:hypothetical protein